MVFLLGVGYTGVIFQIIFATVFICGKWPISTKYGKIFDHMRTKKVRHALLCQKCNIYENCRKKYKLINFTHFYWIFLYFWCLIICKWGQNARFWKFCENRTLHFRDMRCFRSKLSMRALFNFSRKVCTFHLFQVYQCKDIVKFDIPTKFEHSIMISLPVASICLFLKSVHWITYRSTNFSPVLFNRKYYWI